MKITTGKDFISGVPSVSEKFDVGVSFFAQGLAVIAIVETDSTVTFDERVETAGQWVLDTYGFDPRTVATKVGVEALSPTGQE